MRRHHNVEASLLGTGVPEAKVRADFPADLQPRVQVVERFERDRLPTLLVGHSILLFPSLFEGFASAVLEAMACGLAPVVTAIPGIAERLTDGVNALIVPPRNSAALSAALEILIGSPERLSEMRRRAHALAQNFAWTRIAAQTVALYEEARGWPRPGIR
jgi:glycosyltransferase involved in cell wall biosynthesis